MEGGGDELGPAPVPSVGGGSAGVGGACRIAGSRRGCLKRLQKEYHALCKVAGAAAADRGSPAAQRHIGVALSLGIQCGLQQGEDS
nr:uncharacterized protein LOC117842092 isoform X3 [Setaria viridis]